MSEKVLHQNEWINLERIQGIQQRRAAKGVSRKKEKEIQDDSFILSLESNQPLQKQVKTVGERKFQTDETDRKSMLLTGDQAMGKITEKY